MSSDKIVIFDWGGVVHSHENDCLDMRQAIVRVAKKFNCQLDDEYVLDSWQKILHLDNIDIDIVGCPKELQKRLDCLSELWGVSISFEKFKSIYEKENAEIPYYKDVVDFAHSLKSRCQIGILSNLNYFSKKLIDRNYDLSKFDHVYLSFELGMRKPDQEIYDYVQQDLGLPPENILFIDDIMENIVAAKENGWQTCHATGRDLGHIKSTVEKFLDETRK
jgi:putative hydrolase of the HAD superfamily